MKGALLVIAAAGLIAAGAAQAQSGADLAKAKGCLNCHDMEVKKVGPSIKDIAARNKGGEAKLVEKLKEGKGHMKVAASDAELKTLVQYMLTAK